MKPLGNLSPFAPPYFAPTRYSGCPLWLKADRRVTIATGISVWSDLSGQGNDATQATPAKQPALQSSGINGRPAVLFDGVQRLLTTSGPNLSGSAVTVFHVAQYVSSIGGARTYSFVPAAQAGDGAGQGFLLYAPTGNMGMYSNPSEVEADATRPADGTPFVHCGVIDGAHVTSYLNGGAATHTTVCADLVTGSQLWLGCGKAGGVENFLQNVLLGEFILYDRALSDIEREHVTQYLGAGFGIAVA